MKKEHPAEILSRRPTGGVEGYKAYIRSVVLALVITRRHIFFNSARTLLLMLARASTPSLVSSGTTAPRTAAGKNACCATAAAAKQEDPEPALARAAATGQAGNTARVSHTTPVTIRKTRVPDTRSRGLTVATVKKTLAQGNTTAVVG